MVEAGVGPLHPQLDGRDLRRAGGGADSRDRAHRAHEPLRRVEADLRADPALVRPGARAAAGPRCATFNAAGASEAAGEDHRPETHLMPLALRAAAGRREPLCRLRPRLSDPRRLLRPRLRPRRGPGRGAPAGPGALARAPGGIYNLGNGEGFSVLEVSGSVERVTGRTGSPGRPRPASGRSAAAGGEQRKGASRAGLDPSRGDLDIIVETAWRWMQEHPDGYAASS